MKNLPLLLLSLAFSTALLAQKPAAYYDSGQIKWQGNFNLEGTDTIKQGYWIYYHPNGQLAASGEFRRNLKHGDWKLFYPSGIIKDMVRFSNGTMIGTRKQFNELGTLQQVEAYRNGLLDGEYKEFFSSGIIKVTGRYSRGQPIGEWRHFQASGSLLSISKFRVTVVGDSLVSLKNGLFEIYQSSGKLQEKGQYKDDKRVGNWQFFNPNGTIREAATYDQEGAKTASTRYDASGQPIKQ
ncbi:MAG: toxin-antitoxin system YwqK family antitoxin [Bacteroidota bacterium]